MSGRKAFTLVELLVVTGLVAVLASLLLPAVNRAREAAWRAQCQANLRQIGVAVHSYHDSHRMYPGPTHVGGLIEGRNRNSYLSILAQLLPHLDASSIYDLINMQMRVPLDFELTTDSLDEQRTAMRQPIAVFLCPADAGDMRNGSVSYRGNYGLGPYWLRTAEFPDSEMGFFATPPLFGYSYNFSAIVDGMSQTAMFSERSIGSAILTADALFPEGVYDADQTARLCAALSQVSDRAGHYDVAGHYWFFTGLHQTLYTHALPPNSRVTDCQQIAYPPIGLATARSHHTSGVNVLFGDASGKFISDSIDIYLWRAIATRNGFEQQSGVGL